MQCIKCLIKVLSHQFCPIHICIYCLSIFNGFIPSIVFLLLHLFLVSCLFENRIVCKVVVINIIVRLLINVVVNERVKMGKTACCDKHEVKRGAWTHEEDEILVEYINKHGHGSWRTLPKQAGSCSYFLLAMIFDVFLFLFLFDLLCFCIMLVLFLSKGIFGTLEASGK